MEAISPDGDVIGSEAAALLCSSFHAQPCPRSVPLYTLRVESLDFGNHSLIYDGLMILFHGRKLRGLSSVYERVAITGRKFADFKQSSALF